MASALRKLFKSADRHRSGDRAGGWKRKNNNSNKNGAAESPTHHNHSAAMRFFGHCPSPRMSKRDTNKISPEDGANTAKSAAAASGACGGEAFNANVADKVSSNGNNIASQIVACASSRPNPNHLQNHQSQKVLPRSMPKLLEHDV
ncbi:ubiquitin-conjugating enzyme E2Q-like protein CG4502 [Caerostris extrusa]|uniref:Ubiquitin-conjugating enzyme E2Q-like protein CG4502 n=1 Tax=Caerostris extrusa TaxID=172846 RepID=A0AAV4NKE9_CAEEX|nr:ubiquitin-conjugating enzyme E2Q-like protein CG4502 [Caerostris extrusa]